MNLFDVMETIYCISHQKRYLTDFVRTGLAKNPVFFFERILGFRILRNEAFILCVQEVVNSIYIMSYYINWINYLLDTRYESACHSLTHCINIFCFVCLIKIRMTVMLKVTFSFWYGIFMSTGWLNVSLCSSQCFFRLPQFDYINH